MEKDDADFNLCEDEQEFKVVQKRKKWSLQIAASITGKLIYIFYSEICINYYT